MTGAGMDQYRTWSDEALDERALTDALTSEQGAQLDT